MEALKRQESGVERARSVEGGVEACCWSFSPAGRREAREGKRAKSRDEWTGSRKQETRGGRGHKGRSREQREMVCWRAVWRNVVG